MHFRTLFRKSWLAQLWRRYNLMMRDNVVVPYLACDQTCHFIQINIFVNWGINPLKLSELQMDLIILLFCSNANNDHFHNRYVVNLMLTYTTGRNTYTTHLSCCRTWSSAIDFATRYSRRNKRLASINHHHSRCIYKSICKRAGLFITFCALSQWICAWSQCWAYKNLYVPVNISRGEKLKCNWRNFVKEIVIFVFRFSTNNGSLKYL